MIRYFCDMCYREMFDERGEGVIDIYTSTQNFIIKEPDKRIMCCDECINFISSVISNRLKSDEIKKFLRGNEDSDWLDNVTELENPYGR